MNTSVYSLLGIFGHHVCNSRWNLMEEKRQHWYKIFSPTYMMQASSGYSAGESATAKCSNSQALALHVGGIVTFRSFLNKFWKKNKVITGFPLKYFFHFMLVDNSPIHSILLWIMGFKDLHNSKMKHIWSCLVWAWNMKSLLKLLKWKWKKKKKGADQNAFHVQNFSKETDFLKLLFIS